MNWMASCGKAFFAQGLVNQFNQGAVRVDGLTAAAQNSGIAGLQRQPGHVDGHVGARFVDNSQHTQRNALLAHVQAVGQSTLVENLAGRVG